jgi:hypothetical protein
MVALSGMIAEQYPGLLDRPDEENSNSLANSGMM